MESADSDHQIHNINRRVIVKKKLLLKHALNNIN